MGGRVDHEKIYGLAAVRAVFERRPEDVLRIAHTEEVRLRIADLLREAASRRIGYEQRTDEELENIAGAVHHEGICISARPRRVLGVDALVGALRDGKCRAAIALDDVSNPHNVGAILRTAAFFGVEALLIASPEDRAPIAPAAVRIAQGGAEHVVIVRCDALAPALRRIADARVMVLGTDVRGARSIDEVRWPARAVIALGSEAEGMTNAVRGACTELVTIPGSGAVDSLNVSVAAGVVLAAWSRARSGT